MSKEKKVVPFQQPPVFSDEILDLIQVGTEITLYHTFRTKQQRTFIQDFDLLPKSEQDKLLACDRQAIARFAELIIKQLSASQQLEYYYEQNKDLFWSLVKK
ncbi:hypothetical protein [Enterococcus columbae]|uniref:Uncharacterized protein n=1 Tax=Enterococcus columbae DSM 7374 = ATCC 51263 TaxID=1121865 RepID=S1NJB0_9ENTE|nr:hypothetical protein [Enterococcus columbae]EOT40505.1 hypothetical protein OMW_01367 [Enterococcus columbae DSM 7374 = ATCC 51263]EOW80281.1 hypothetical protein I568_01981 [Enterococcus columbae DSM 7374 = ATCC 51263]